MQLFKRKKLQLDWFPIILIQIFLFYINIFLFYKKKNLNIQQQTLCFLIASFWTPKLKLDNNRHRKEMFFLALWIVPSRPGEQPLGSTDSMYMAAPNSSKTYTWFPLLLMRGNSFPIWTQFSTERACSAVTARPHSNYKEEASSQ